jgi:uncharacterized integral membrane protein
MEPTPSTATLIDPASIPSIPAHATAPAVPGRAFAGEPLPRQVVWAAVIVAAVLPVILLLTLISCVASENFNFFTWME